MAKVVLDAAYGGQDPGYVFGNRLEKNDNLRMALAVGDILERNNIEVAYTRTSDKYLNLIERANIANQVGGDLFVTFYRKRGAGPFQIPCVSFFISENNGVGEMVSDNIAKHLLSVGFHNMGTEILNNILLTGLKMPATMVRIGFIDSEENNELYDNRFDDIANAIATAIMESLELLEDEIQTQSNNKCKSCKGSGTYKHIVMDHNRMNNYRYKVQVGVYRNYNNAMNIQYQLYQLGFPAELAHQHECYAIRIGEFSDMDEAVTLECLLKRIGYDTLLIAL